MQFNHPLFNDPIYGFIAIESDLILELINHPYFQRLRHITQMGLSSLVYPGAHHTRFEHAIGAMHVMQKAINVLLKKEIYISEKEQEAMQIAILLHDIGHGPFSHATEKTLLSGVNHEELSIRIIKLLNEEFKGALSLALKIFTNKYTRGFMHQLVSGQVDVDRLDYLKRDSFYTGVTEGNINTERILSVMNVENEQLVFESKGIHSLEKFLLARRLMYWQVYLHKTSLVAEHMLVKVLMRAKELAENNIDLFCSSSLRYFLYNRINKDNFDTRVLDLFSKLDDYDLLSAIKEWTNHPDKTISNLSKMIVDRNLLKVEIHDKAVPEIDISKHINRIMNSSGLTKKEASYFVFKGDISNQAYNIHQPIKILNKKGILEDIVQASDQLNLQALSKPVKKFFICYPKKWN